MSQEVLLYISLIIGVAAIITIITKLIRQPSIIAYIISGVLVGPLFLNLIGPTTPYSDLIQLFAHIGVALLLFIVGLSLDFRVLKEFGPVSLFAGLGQIILTAIIGFLISIGLGFNSMTSLYLAAALTFSSTVLVVKILSDKKEMDTLYARISLGILIIQDFAAAIALMIAPTLNKGFDYTIMIELGKITGIILLIFAISYFVLRKAMPYLARNQEVLFLFGIAWALILAAVFDSLGFSLEIGALIAGMSLASSKYTLELGSKIKPLRDFFIVLFFVFFGSQLFGTIDWKLIYQALILSAFVIIGKPLVVMIIMRIAGYKKRVNFLTGTSIAQISEFSLILILLGFNMGYLSHEVMSLTVLVAIITIGISSYGLYYSHYIFDKMSNFLNVFEGSKEKEDKKPERKYQAILLGYHRIGHKVLDKLKKMKVKTLVIDYNPQVIIDLNRKGIDSIYGDASNKELLKELDLINVKLIISTIPDLESNRTLQEYLSEVKYKGAFIATSEQPRSALELYNEGVDYVIIPQHLGGEFMSDILGKFKVNASEYKALGKAHSTQLKKSKEESNFK